MNENFKRPVKDLFSMSSKNDYKNYDQKRIKLVEHPYYLLSDRVLYKTFSINQLTVTIYHTYHLKEKHVMPSVDGPGG